MSVPRKRIILLAISTILLTSVVLLIILLSQNQRITPISITYASVPAIIEAPAHIAYQNGIFDDQGLDVTLEINPDGKTSLDHLFEGSVDIAAVMATPIVYRSLKHDDFVIIGKIDHTKIHFAYALDKSEIIQPQDIVGKKVAIMPGTSGHYFLHNWLLYNHISPEDIITVPYNGPEAVEAMINQRVDAMFYWFPYPQLVKEQLEDRVSELESSKLVPSSWVIVTTQKFADNNPQAITRFLKSIKQAISFIKENPETALSLYAEMHSFDEELVGSIFSTLDLEIGLDQALILDLEEQARWAISLLGDESITVPNYLDFIDSSFLKEVDPLSVSLISR